MRSVAFTDRWSRLPLDDQKWTTTPEQGRQGAIRLKKRPTELGAPWAACIKHRETGEVEPPCSPTYQIKFALQCNLGLVRERAAGHRWRYLSIIIRRSSSLVSTFLNIARAPRIPCCSK